MPENNPMARAARLGKQFVAGIGEVFGPGKPKVDFWGRPLPAAQQAESTNQIRVIDPAINSVYGLAQLISEAPVFSHRLHIPAMERRLERAERYAQQLNKDLGTTDPENAVEAIIRYAGPALIGPNMPIGIPRTVTGLAKVPAAVGRVAAESVMPFVQGGAKTRAVAAAIPAAVAEGFDAVENDDTYNSLTDIVNPSRNGTKEKTVDDYLTPELAELYERAARLGDEQSTSMISDYIKDQIQADVLNEAANAKSEWEGPAIDTAIAAVATIGGISAARNVQRFRDRLRSKPKLAGPAEEEVNTPLADRVWGGVVQSDQAVRSAVARTTGQKDRKLGIGNTPEQEMWDAKFDGISAGSINSKTAHFVATGEVRGMQTQVEPLAPLLNAVASLSPAEQKMLTDGLLAATSLDDYARTGNQASFLKDRDGNPTTVDELRELKAALDNNPRLARYATAVKQQYRAQIDMLREAGDFLTDAEYQALVTNSPNYVHMSKNVVDNLANTLLDGGREVKYEIDAPASKLFSRATDPGAGVRTGEAANPVTEIASQWQRTIRMIEVNKVKKPLLELLSTHAETKGFVKRLPAGSRPNKEGGNYQIAWDRGEPVYYLINDNALAAALDFNPFTAYSTLSNIAAMPKKGFEFGTTGPLTGFGPSSMMYDTVASILNKPKGVAIGPLAEVVGRVSKGKWDISGVDPTAWLAGVSGAARLARSGLIQAMSEGLATQILKNDVGASVFGMSPQAAKNLQLLLAKWYETSTKAQMEATGAGNSGLFTSSTTDQLAGGTARAAPRFNTVVLEQAYADFLRGNSSTFTKLLQSPKHLGGIGLSYVQASAAARAIKFIDKMFKEGVRYQVYAANAPKLQMNPELEALIASQTRRIAGDGAQVGASALAKGIAQHAIYGNISIQGMAQWARMIKAEPMSVSYNAIATMLTLGAAFLYGLRDPEERARVRAMTDDELVRSVPIFGGIPINIPPERRAFMGPYIGLLRDMSGIMSVDENGVDKFDPSFVRMAERYLLDGPTDDGIESIGYMAKMGAGNLAPINMTSSPLLNLYAAGAGNLDIGFTRYMAGAGDDLDPQSIRQQDYSELYGDGRYIGDALSAQHAKMFEHVAGATWMNFARAAMDTDRAIDGTYVDSGWDIFLSRIADGYAKQNNPVVAPLFRNYEKLRSPNVQDFRLFYDKKTGFEAAIEDFDKSVRSPDMNGLDEDTAMPSQLSAYDIEFNSRLAGTQIAVIGGVAKEVASEIKSLKLDSLASGLNNQIEDVRNQRHTTIEQRNAEINRLNKERIAAVRQMMEWYKTGEEVIRDRIGDQSFTWQKYVKDPKKYLRPLEPPVPEQAPE